MKSLTFLLVTVGLLCTVVAFAVLQSYNEDWETHRLPPCDRSARRAHTEDPLNEDEDLQFGWFS